MTTQPVEPTGAPQRLGDYTLHGVLGAGGMGVVHLGLEASGRAVAIKVLRDHVAHDPIARRRLAREVATLRRVEHPAIAPFLGADVEGERPYIVTKYVRGDALDVWVGDHGPLTGERLTGFAVRLAEALEAIHAAGVIHRDLKPGNVLMENGLPFIIDFGIAHVADESRLTSTGLVMGTPGYLAPELLDGQDVSVATDLWGYAATLAFAATGRPPFGRGPIEGVQDRVRRGAADLAGLDPWLVDLLHECLSPEPAGRPALAVMRHRMEQGDTTDRTVAVPAASERTQAVPMAGSTTTAVHPVIDTRIMPAVSVPPPTTPAPTQGQAAASPYAGFGGAGAPPGGAAPSHAEPLISHPYRGHAPGPHPGSGQRADPGVWHRPDSAAVAHGAPGQRSGSYPSGPEPDRGARRGPSARTGTLVALGLVFVALTGYMPGLGVLVALGWSWLARFVDRSATSVALRRAERGPRDSDIPLAVLASPWHLVGSFFGAVMAGLVPLLVGASFAFGLRALANDVQGVPVGMSSTIMIGAAAAVMVAWWGPGGTTLRRGSRTTVRALSPGRVGARLATVALSVSAGLLALMTQAGSWRLSWWPLDGLQDFVPWIARALGF